MVRQKTLAPKYEWLLMASALSWYPSTPTQRHSASGGADFKTFLVLFPTKEAGFMGSQQLQIALKSFVFPVTL